MTTIVSIKANVSDRSMLEMNRRLIVNTNVQAQTLLTRRTLP